MQSGPTAYNKGWNAYSKIGDIGSPMSPSLAIVFLEENMATLNDGFLQVNDNGAGGGDYWPDIPGSYHTWECGISFADSHVEMHKWQTSALKIPIQAGKGYDSGGAVPVVTGGPKNQDYIWWVQHTSTRD